MAASVRVCCVLRIAFGGPSSAPLRLASGLVQVSHFSSQALQTSFKTPPTPPLLPLNALQQIRHGSFFNKLPAVELWKGVMADSGAGSKKGRGKRTKRRLKKNLNYGQFIGEGQGGFLWPALNKKVMFDGSNKNMGRRGKLEQQEYLAEKFRQREEFEKKRKVKVKRERGWTGYSWGGVSLGTPSCEATGEVYEDFDSRIIEVKTVFHMTAKDGKKRQISCLVAVGNGQGAAGFALGKAYQRRAALRKALNRATRYLYFIERYNDHTIYHDINAKFKRTTLRMKKQNEGYGLRCHRAVTTLCKLIGIKDLYCKVEGSVNLLNITRALFTALATQQTHQALADKKQLHVVEFQDNRGPLPIVVASPKDGARLDPEIRDEVPDTELHWDDVRAAQGFKRSSWATTKRST